jgi:hypothetical protein
VKQYTADQVQAKKDKAVQFLRDVVGNDDKANEFDDMDVDEYAQRKDIQIVNPRRNRRMANGTWDPRTKQELLDEIDDLQSQIDAINDIVNPPDDEDDDDGDDYDVGQD